MKVTKDLVVSLAYQVRTEDGVLVDESPVSAPLDYLHGHGSLIAGLENALEGHEAGDSFDVRVNADEGYGSYDENLVQRVPKTSLWALTSWKWGCVFWQILIKAQYRLRSLLSKTSTSWLMVTTCWRARI